MVRATYATKDLHGQWVSMRLNSDPNDDQRQLLSRLGMRSRRKPVGLFSQATKCSALAFCEIAQVTELASFFNH